MAITIAQAIRDLQARVDGEFSIKGVDDCEDMKLGVEALKRQLDAYGRIRNILEMPLPGETEE